MEYKLIDHSIKQCGTIESAIQHKPTHNDNFTWNHPNPRAFTACVTVYVSVK